MQKFFRGSEEEVKLCTDLLSGIRLTEIRLEMVTRQAEGLWRQVDEATESVTWRILLAMRAFRRRTRLKEKARSQCLGCLAKSFISTAREVGRSIREKLSGARQVDTGMDIAAYDRWIELNEPGTDDMQEQRLVRLCYEPRISLVVSTYEPSIRFLMAMLNSVQEQTYSNWELCIADGSISKPEVRRALQELEHDEPRLKLLFLSENRGIVGNTNAALGLATGEFVAFLGHDDTLSPFALFEVVNALHVFPDADLLYSDEDKLSPCCGQRLEPHFKPAWSPELLRSVNYIRHLAVYRRDLLCEVGGLREGFDGAQDYDLVLRFTDRCSQVVHIPKILYHWRIHPKATSGNAGSKPCAFDGGCRALREHHERAGRNTQINRSDSSGCYHTRYAVPRMPLVSLVIPNRDHTAVLRRCLESVAKSTYSRYEIIVVENNSKERATHAYYQKLQVVGGTKILKCEGPFNFSAAVNLGVGGADGEVVVLLNNDIEVISRDWLERLVEQVLRPEVGAVGAKLFYPDDTIQHAGVIVGVQGIAGHCHYRFPRNHSGYFGRLGAAQNLSAVTGACLAVRKAVYEQVGGFEEGYPLAFGDIDFCLKLRAKGYLNVWTPMAELYHHESLTRGADDTPEKLRRLRVECALFRRRWLDLLRQGDPYYNPNMSLREGNFTPATKVVLQMPRTATVNTSAKHTRAA